MKRIHHTINAVLSAIIVTLGFGSCVSQKNYNAAQEEIKQLQEKNAILESEIHNLQQQISSFKDYQKQFEERKVVYGPRPTEYREKINK